LYYNVYVYYIINILTEIDYRYTLTHTEFIHLSPGRNNSIFYS